MNDLVSSIRAAVNFESYSSSRFFAGYIRVREKASVVSMVKALGACTNKKKFIVVGKAFYPGRAALQRDYLIAQDFYEDFVDPLISLKCIVEKPDISDQDWSLIEGFYEPSIEKIDEALLVDLCFWMMFGGGLLGHLFIVLDGIDAVMYLSDDQAIGFIGLTEVGREAASAFLSKREKGDGGINF